jgi:hypothetical protein
MQELAETVVDITEAGLAKKRNKAVAANKN